MARSPFWDSGLPPDLLRLVDAFDAEGARYVIVGGMAMVPHVTKVVERSEPHRGSGEPMTERYDFGNKSPRGIDLDRLSYARSLTPAERLERNRRAAESVILLREAGRRMREERMSRDRELGEPPPEDLKT